MALAEALDGGLEERNERELVESVHENVTDLVIVLESHLASMSRGDPFNGSIMLEALDYILDYASELYGERWTGSARHAAIHTTGAELYHRLDLALRDEAIDRNEIVSLGYAYCRELRRLIVADRRSMSAPPLSATRATDERYRARFESLTKRVGCGCGYEGACCPTNEDAEDGEEARA